jgi:hypothetical protein
MSALICSLLLTADAAMNSHRRFSPPWLVEELGTGLF